jgi:tripartite-type tricarboxylate transporter receptor subunit TctC
MLTFLDALYLMSRSWFVFLLVVAALAPGATFAAWPDRPVRFIIPGTAGASTDIMCRVVAGPVSAALGQPFVFDNRPGAGGSIGAELAARAAPDGYTLAMANISILAINPIVHRGLRYDPRRDFAPVSNLGLVANVLITSPTLGVDDFAALVAHLKSRPDRYNHASAGNGTLSHLLTEWFNRELGIRTRHIPYKGGAQTYVDLASGQVVLYYVNMPGAVPHIRAGRVRAMAVAAPGRVDGFANVPTFTELGLAAFNAPSWFGVIAPRGTPQPIIERMQREIAAAVKTPEITARLHDIGVIPLGNTPEAYGRQIHDEIDKWARVAKLIGFTPE